MTVGKAVLLTVVLVAVFIVGVISGPTIHQRWSDETAPATTVSAPAAGPVTPAPAKAKARKPRAKPSSPRADDVVAAKKAPDTIQTIAVAVWEPDVRGRVKEVLSPGSDLEIAAADFDNSEQFVTVAHAARNTKVPFMVLKDGLLNKGQSLAQTIHEFKPELDAKAEVRRARAAARADLGIAG
jgi:uncharacterized membrane protein